MKLASALRSCVVPVMAVLIFSLSAELAQADVANEIRVDIPVALKEAKVVFNMDHAAFNGDSPVGLAHMTLMVDRFKQVGTKWKIAAIFHGDAGYMLLNDESYNTARKIKTGNPYKSMIEKLISEGVDIEECMVTMKGNKWTNSSLLAGVKVDSGADGRIIELVQQGYVMLQP
jgi:intracellular sulfur oxidation DsrE/DsrF family protein